MMEKKSVVEHLAISQKLVELLKKKYGERLISVVLFGSVARGEARKDSDIDIIIVVDGLPKSRLKRQEEFLEVEKDILPEIEELQEKGYFIDISPVLRTPEEILKFPPLMLDVVEDGIILYDKNEFFRNAIERLKKRLEELGATRVRIGKRWFWILKPDYRFGEVIEIE